MAIKKVMLVDDDASIRRIGEICLSKVGKWEVVLCHSAKHALEIVESEQPDVILLDVMMPHLDGITAFPDLQKKTKRAVPIIFMTAKVMKHETGRYTDLGAAGVISKPFEPMSLPAEVKSIVAEYEQKLPRMVCA
jgi:two-component system OmpR family response regulator